MGVVSEADVGLILLLPWLIAYPTHYYAWSGAESDPLVFSGSLLFRLEDWLFPDHTSYWPAAVESLLFAMLEDVHQG